MSPNKLTALFCIWVFGLGSGFAFGQVQECEAHKRKIQRAWLEASQLGQTVKADALRDEYFEVQRSCRQSREGPDTGEYGRETFNIDRLTIVRTSGYDPACESGANHRFTLTGVIGPDSTFAMKELLHRHSGCRTAGGELTVPVTVSLKSAGGFLNDGYSLGQLFRDEKVTTVVENGEACASSCAVAFLGGNRRIVQKEGVIMYHAPYFTGENAYGKRDINCEVGKDALADLNSYYRKMTDAETGDRLFDRTMWYCSADDGWVIKGASAAELYGIATEK